MKNPIHYFLCVFTVALVPSQLHWPLSCFPHRVVEASFRCKFGNVTTTLCNDLPQQFTSTPFTQPTYLNDLCLLHSCDRLTSTIYLYFIFTQPTYLNDLPLLHSHNRLSSTMYLYFIHTTNLPQRFTFTELPQRFIHITVFIVKRWALAYVAESQTG